MLLVALLLIVIGVCILVLPPARQAAPLGWVLTVIGLVVLVLALAGGGGLDLEHGFLTPLLGLRKRLRLPL